MNKAAKASEVAPDAHSSRVGRTVQKSSPGRDSNDKETRMKSNPTPEAAAESPSGKSPAPPNRTLPPIASAPSLLPKEKLVPPPQIAPGLLSRGTKAVVVAPSKLHIPNNSASSPGQEDPVFQKYGEPFLVNNCGSVALNDRAVAIKCATTHRVRYESVPSVTSVTTETAVFGLWLMRWRFCFCSTTS